MYNNFQKILISQTWMKNFRVESSAKFILSKFWLFLGQIKKWEMAQHFHFKLDGKKFKISWKFWKFENRRFVMKKSTRLAGTFLSLASLSAPRACDLVVALCAWCSMSFTYKLLHLFYFKWNKKFCKHSSIHFNAVFVSYMYSLKNSIFDFKYFKSKHKIYILLKNVLMRICRPHLGK